MWWCGCWGSLNAPSAWWHCRNGGGADFPAWCGWGLFSCPKLGLTSLLWQSSAAVQYSSVQLCPSVLRGQGALSSCPTPDFSLCACSSRRKRGHTQLLAMRPKFTRARVVRLAEDSLYSLPVRCWLLCSGRCWGQQINMLPEKLSK